MWGRAQIWPHWRTCQKIARIILNTIREEITALNQNFGLDALLVVSVETCGEANVFYDSETKQITICTEFEDHLRGLYESVSA
jgi:hypothetical protein